MLAPSISSFSKNIIQSLKLTSSVKICVKTYEEICEALIELLDTNRDAQFLDTVYEFQQYCIDEKLMDTAKTTIKIRAVGETLELNKRYNIYYDNASTNCSGFNYIGLYNDKCVKFVGKITKIVKAELIDNNLDVKVVKTENIKINQLTQEDSEKLKKLILENFVPKHNLLTEPHTYFFVDNFVATDFKKSTKGPLFGSRVINLKKFGVTKQTSTEQVAEILKTNTWE